MTQIAAHKLVAKVAAEAAGELYETVMGDNRVREEWKRQNPGASEKELFRRFVLRNTHKCLAFARSTLATMLTDPGIDITTRDAIVEALALDAQIPGRMAPGAAQRAIEIINREKLH